MSSQLDPADVDAIAARVVEILDERVAPPRLVTAAELSRSLGLSRSTVYEKADELGAVRIGSGPRARLRFDVDLVAKRLGVGRPSTGPVDRPVAGRSAPARRRRRARRPARPGLLPIRGETPR